MRFYFSGISSRHELDKLKEAKVSRILMDPAQYERFHHHVDSGTIALDSGAYRDWKGGHTGLLSDFIVRLLHYRESDSWGFDFIASLDDMENPTKTLNNWHLLCQAGFDTVPIWHYRPGGDGIEPYLGASEIGVGKLVPLLFTDADPATKKAARKGVAKLCAALPHRLRLFGACDVPLLNAVAGTALSADSSIWLRGSRRGVWIFRDQDGRLRQANRGQQRMLAGKYDGFEQALAMTPHELDIANARTLEAQFNQ